MRSAKMRRSHCSFRHRQRVSQARTSTDAPAPKDRGVFDDMNYAANATEPRKEGTLRDRRR
jgi:hypothetical protein